MGWRRQKLLAKGGEFAVFDALDARSGLSQRFPGNLIRTTGENHELQDLTFALKHTVGHRQRHRRCARGSPKGDLLAQNGEALGFPGLCACKVLYELSAYVLHEAIEVAFRRFLDDNGGHNFLAARADKAHVGFRVHKDEFLANR